ncbi:unnamed protein product [Durusdinium trenchii]|uniref:Uncharacterized protein n=2 Tax=Durusdinium trenchii TaxID=1381693 RepID=A0ABP0JPJ2_9DINO
MQPWRSYLPCPECALQRKPGLAMPIYGSSGISGARMHRSNVACLPFYSKWAQQARAPVEQQGLNLDHQAEKVPNIRKINSIVNAALDISESSQSADAPPRQKETFNKTLERFSGEMTAEWSSSLRGANARYQGSPFALTARRTGDSLKPRSDISQIV